MDLSDIIAAIGIPLLVTVAGIAAIIGAGGLQRFTRFFPTARQKPKGSTGEVGSTKATIQGSRDELDAIQHETQDAAAKLRTRIEQVTAHARTAATRHDAAGERPVADPSATQPPFPEPANHLADFVERVRRADDGDLQ